MQRKHPKLYFRGESRPQVFPIQGSDREDNQVSQSIKQGQEKFIKTRQPKVVMAWSKSTRDWGVEQRIKTNREFNTLNTGDGGGSQSTQNFVSEGVRIRRLTPIECERLQGFPDNWTQGVSDTQRYKQLGNAVTVNVVYEIAKKLPY